MISRLHSSALLRGRSQERALYSNHFRPRAALAAALALGLGAFSLSAPGQQLYRWVDDDGKTHFSDRLPPEATGKARVELSEEGIPVREVERAKTREEWLQEQELERLRRETQAQVDKQRKEDEILLRSYRSADDLMMMRDGKIEAIDVMIQQIKGNIRRLQNRVNRLQANAADLERAGKPIHPTLEGDIRSTKDNIEDQLALILQHERDKQGVYEKFAEDLERFRRLKDVREPVVDQSSEQVRLGLKNLVLCANDRECDLLWGQAIGYVEAHSTQPIESLSDNVVITTAPQDEEDISLIVSRIAIDATSPDAGSVLFLDLQCSSYTETASSCRTPARIEVLEGFRAALLGDAAGRMPEDKSGEDAGAAGTEATSAAPERAPAPAPAPAQKPAPAGQ
ncbi:hypothetical protein Thi970DRAFT_03498 [Thiorhodovibrio frisius]|uniref:DUF4124 domain-containing protein n=1 Tax=Thiorhodovibrio frisius TaxID=631362 RepID=H8Z7N9_9GAMM|nr:hypothetical protein Thi970DRAFT_03498 [Thiorhodovibrio frisius]WPL20620.1 hypothetical protein Thiofri_00719 [Thiorhodovibrio frisius]